MDQESLKQLLQSALAPDTARVKEATAKLKQDYYKQPQSLGLLLQILTDDDSSNEIRQIAANQARALVPRYWNAVPENRKPQIRDHVLQFTLREESSKVRHNAARVVAAIAKVDSEDGQWAELPEVMGKISMSPDPKEREVGTYVLFTILETMADESLSHFSSLFTLFSKTIHDSESGEVRINTLLALSKMALVLDADNDEESIQNFQKALPAMVGVLKQTMDARDEERTLQAFEVFQTLLECDARLLNKYFGDLVTFMSEAASAVALDKDVRVAALNFLVSCLLYRKLKFQGLRVGEQMVERLFNILSTTDDSGSDDEDYGITFAVLSLLSLMSSQLPPTQAAGPVIRLFKQYATSSQIRERQTALTALASSVEGAPEFVDTQIEEIKPLLLQLLNDRETKVREAAVSATKELAESLPESLGKDHQKFMAALAKNLNSAVIGLDGSDSKTSLSIVVNCCTAIDGLVVGLESNDLQGYLSELVPHMSELFTHPDIKIKAAAIGAVGSIAEASKEAFKPYFEKTMSDLSTYVRAKDSEDDMNMRALVTDTMGDVAIAVGPAAFQRYVQPLMEATEEGLNLDNPRLKETSYMFWGTLAKVYKEDFKPFLPGIVKALFAALEQKESDLEVSLGEEADDLVGAEVVIGGKKIKVVSENDDEDDDDEIGDAEDDDDDDDSDDGWGDITGLSAVAEEKEIAVEALAEIFSHTGREFLPYFEKSIELILPLVDHSYEGTRRAAISSLYRAYGSLWEVSGSKWEPGLPVKVKPSSEVTKLGEVVLGTTLALWMADDDIHVILEINRNIAETLKLCGPALISTENAVEQIVQTLVAILTKKHVCQMPMDEDDEVEDDLESSEDDMWVIETAMDAVTGLAKALGSQFGELWKIFEKLILQYASATDASQRSAAVGAVADAIRGMGGAVTPFTTGLLKIILHRLGDEDPQVKSNAAFAAGVLVEHSDEHQQILKAYPTILSKLEPLLHTQESRQLDNAAGCVSRMIMKHPDHIPIAEVVPALVGLLPLREDYEENTPVYEMIIGLYKAGNSTIQGLSGQVMSVLQQVLSPPEEQLTDEMREQVQQLVKVLQQHGN